MGQDLVSFSPLSSLSRLTKGVSAYRFPTSFLRVNPLQAQEVTSLFGFSPPCSASSVNALWTQAAVEEISAPTLSIDLVPYVPLSPRSLLAKGISVFRFRSALLWVNPVLSQESASLFRLSPPCSSSSVDALRAQAAAKYVCTPTLSTASLVPVCFGMRGFWSKINLLRSCHILHKVDAI
ncbi:uncharacterized protein LOC120294111 [Eucalyptus grandis]|uniref:uncharacterized protein LOC120294111 n=1 Tax=Eucalyptus grandis TaxID=71139 RepID=UPI00192F00BD|nr:uncharacterized protein LOC120294111 [Eucalyptus grandis]